MDVRKEALFTIQQLRDGKISTKDAAEVRNLLGVIVDTARVQNDFIRALPKSISDKITFEDVKGIVGAVKNADAEIDLTLDEINKNKNKYLFDKDRK